MADEKNSSTKKRIRLRPAAAAILAGVLMTEGRPAPAAADGPRPAFLLAECGRPAAEIVLSPAADAHDRRAAEILRDAVREMSGAELPVRTAPSPGRGRQVVLGFDRNLLPAAVRNKAAALRHDGFLDAVSGGNLHIVSGGHKGAIYGVVHLLEAYFGCRVFSPEARLFPRRDTLGLGPLRELENPVNEVRIVNGDFARDADFRDWLRLDAADEIYGRGYYVHTFDKLVPWRTYFAGHPEYYAWMNGKRVIDQPCPSRPEVFEIAAARLRQAMAAQPDRTVWSVSQNDNFSYCRCPDCLRAIEEDGSPSGPILRLVNRLAALFPDKIISTLAYQYSRPAPRVTRPAGNVEIMLCTIELNRARPIAEDPASRSFVRDIADWARIGRRIYLWDYTVNFSHHVAPFPNLHVLQPNLRLFAAHAVRRHFQQTNLGPGHEFSELKGWLLARLLWNPEIDAEAAMDEFLEGYYGAAAPYLRRYIDGLRKALVRSGAPLDIYEPPAAHAGDYLAAAEVERADAVFDEAEASVAGDPLRRRRVRVARLPLHYAVLEIAKAGMFGPRGFYAERAGRFEARPERIALLEDFRERCREGGVRTLNESGLTPEAYYESVRRFIDVQVEGNLAFRREVSADPPPAAKYVRGDLRLLTDGVRGAGDFKVHWLGWEGVDFILILDLGRPSSFGEIVLSTLSDARSWILHPRSVSCAVSGDGAGFEDVGRIEAEGDHREEPMTRTFAWKGAFVGRRYVRFALEGTKRLPDWHASAGGASWVFVDEIVVR